MNRWLIIAVAVLSPPAVAVLYFFDPTENPWFPKCVLHLLTGLHCPFCGTTRCGHALLSGNLVQAAAWNVLAVLLFPLATLWLVWAVVRVARQRSLPWLNPPSWLLRLSLAVLLLFGVLRNLPFYPFDLLAPHKI